MFGKRKKVLVFFGLKLTDYCGQLTIFLIFNGFWCQNSRRVLVLALVSSLSVLGLVPGSLSVILNVRYFDKNSAKCGIKYIKSILNTAILYYIPPLSHTKHNCYTFFSLSHICSFMVKLYKIWYWKIVLTTIWKIWYFAKIDNL